MNELAYRLVPAVKDSSVLELNVDDKNMSKNVVFLTYVMFLAKSELLQE